MLFESYRDSEDVRAIVLIASWANRGYDAESIRQGLRTRGIRPWIAKRNTEHGSGLGRWRWVIERTFAWLNQFRRLQFGGLAAADLTDVKMIHWQAAVKP